MTHSTPRVEELTYLSDSSELFELIADRPWAVFLDSGRPHDDRGRYDVLAADPMVTIVTSGSMSEIRSQGTSRLSPEDPLTLLRDFMEQFSAHAPAVVEGLPFAGGALGYFAYDLGRRLEKLPVRAVDEDRLPEMAIGIYDWALIVDHEARRSTLVGRGFDERTNQRWEELRAVFTTPGRHRRRGFYRLASPVTSNLNKTRYLEAFRRVQDYISAGDCYQVNLAQRFSCSVDGDMWLAYQNLRELSPAPFGAYLNLPWMRVLSSSPERFLRVVDGAVETMPIKGTRPRSMDFREDRRLAGELRWSQKDRAENVMIVDLMRNDLGKVCVTGSVRVPKLCDLESFPTVHHLVSTVTGRLAPGRHSIDLLRACFPGGSITGAPKLRVMEIIEELEPHRRGVYCGSIGYVGFDGAMDSNIAIRTMIHTQGRLHLWAGGGIVADSDPEAEYQETFDKAFAMLELLRRADVSRVGSQTRG